MQNEVMVAYGMVHLSIQNNVLNVYQVQDKVLIVYTERGIKSIQNEVLITNRMRY